MSKPSRTIRWDDPAYSVKSSEDSSSNLSGCTSLSNNAINMPAGNLIIKPQQAVSAAVTSTSWRELKTREGRAYYYNSVTQKTMWEMPGEYREYLEFSQASMSSSQSSRRSSGAAGDEEFWDVLRERKVSSKWTWEEALRAIITHPNYKCIPTLQERKESFQRYCEAMKSVEEEEARLQSLALKEAFKAFLAADPQILSDTKWSNVVDKHGKSDPFLAIQSSRERVQLFEEYQSELRRTELENVWARRKATFAQISELIQNLNLSIDLERGKFPDWSTIKDTIIGTLPDVDPIEYLLAFEEHCSELLKEYQVGRKVERQSELLKELEYREKYLLLLREFEQDEQLTPFSTWSSFYPLIKGRPEFCNLLSIYLYGSSPIDMFYDALDRCQITYDRDRKRIAEYFKTEFMTCDAARLPKKFSSFTQFKETLKEALNLDNSSVKYAFIELYGEDSINQDRQRINAYKHLLKHLSPPIKVLDTWEIVHERLRGREEYEAVVCEEDRQVYFLKFKKWLLKHTDQDKNHENDLETNKRSRWDKKEQQELATVEIRDDHYNRSNTNLSHNSRRW